MSTTDTTTPGPSSCTASTDAGGITWACQRPAGHAGAHYGGPDGRVRWETPEPDRAEPMTVTAMRRRLEGVTPPTTRSAAWRRVLAAVDEALAVIPEQWDGRGDYREPAEGSPFEALVCARAALGDVDEPSDEVAVAWHADVDHGPPAPDKYGRPFPAWDGGEPVCVVDGTTLVADEEIIDRRHLHEAKPGVLVFSGHAEYLEGGETVLTCPTCVLAHAWPEGVDVDYA